MASRKIETQLTIRGVDKYSSIVGKMSGVTGKFANKVRTDMVRLQGIRGPLKLIADFKKTKETVNKSGAALDAARDKVRRLAHQIKTTKNPTQQMRTEFDRARRSAERLETTHKRNRAALSGLHGGLRKAGVNTSKLAGEERRLAGALDRSNAAMGRQVEKLKRLAVMQDKIANGRKRMDRALATSANLSFVGGASIQTGRRILTGVSKPVDQAIEFESSMSDVKKVVDFDTPDGFKEMSEDILELSTRIPMVGSQIAEIVAAGGQSGIKNNDLLKFAEMAAKIGVAFDVSADLSGTSMAKIKTALKLDLDETGLLFDAMNHLSNNMASEAPTLLDFVRRVGSDGVIAGFDPTQITAFGSAMIAAGAQSDVAGTSFRNMANRLTKGESATKRQGIAYKKLGLDAVSVAKNMQKDAVGTTLDVMERIRKLPAHTQGALISDLFGDEARAIKPLVKNLDLLKEALGLVSDETKFLGSAEAEYLERSKTTANNKSLLNNELEQFGIVAGNTVLPIYNEIITGLRSIVSGMTKWVKEHPKLTKWLLISGAAIGGLAIVSGVLLTAAAGIIGTFAVMRFGMVGLAARAVFASGKFLGLGRIFGTIAGKSPLKWASLIPKLSWRLLIPVLKWGVRFIPVIGWAALLGTLAWHAIIKPLGWDKYITSANLANAWDKVRGVLKWTAIINPIAWLGFIPSKTFGDMWRALKGETSWSSVIEGIDWKDFLWPLTYPTWSWDWITSFDLGSMLKMPKWLSRSPTASPNEDKGFIPPIQRRRAGGAFGSGPLLTGEGGPELEYSNRSGFIAHNGHLKNMVRMSQVIRASGLAALVATGSPATANVSTNIGGGSGGQSIVQNTNHFHIPPSVTNPQLVVDLLSKQLSDVTDASFVD